MTDKKVIINSVDVSGCEWIHKMPDKYCGLDYFCTCNTGTCRDNPDCHYKQLHHLQTENEELKKELDNLKYGIENFCGCKIRDDKTNLPICENADIYKQALETVKGIATDIYENDCYENSDGKAQKILTIINEVLKDGSI